MESLTCDEEGVVGVNVSDLWKLHGWGDGVDLEV